MARFLGKVSKPVLAACGCSKFIFQAPGILRVTIIRDKNYLIRDGHCHVNDMFNVRIIVVKFVISWRLSDFARKSYGDDRYHINILRIK